MRRYPRWYYAPESGSGSGGPSPSPGTASPQAPGEGEASPAPETGYAAEAVAAEEAAGDGRPEDVPGAEIVEVDIEELTAQAEKAQEYLSLAQRTQADFENYRRRVAREAAAAQERGAVKLAKTLLPAVDNLERALAHAPTVQDENGTASFVAGVKQVHDEVLNSLKRAGIEPFSPEGEPFDPTLHEAVAQQPVQGAQPGTVVEVYQPGYRLGESVLRPARVVVAG